MTVQREGAKVSIVGAGAVGSSLAYAALMAGVARRVVLQDVNEAKVKAEALDLAHGSQFFPEASILGSADVAATEHSDVVVITAGAKQKPGQTRLDLAESTVRLMTHVIPPLVERSPDAIFLLVTNPVDVTTQVALDISGLPQERVIGSGTVLDSSRLRQLLAEECDVAVSNVHAYVCGEHGDTEIPLWTSSSIGGVPLLDWERSTGRLGAAKRDEIAHRVVNAAYEVIAGKGATNYAIGLAGTRILQAILRDEHAVLPVSRRLDGWYGLSGMCMSVPTVVSAAGAGRQLELPLSDDELAALRASAATIRDTAERLERAL
ncbi:L-lactate dehydrogenase [Tessaracoccus oleiagri]|uniref:L-lactate dehydrogenase n=1 Tax=Tessaracoccus oleiagri TaxID=686624 RepID=A0A1G9IBN4_9ACTN|nr:L-lactate dehydrogenase [Tessaracoccus oleiagri]SDL22536.1 L-lactate dehydrogenase [Tessaracoccus oleiagri]